MVNPNENRMKNMIKKSLKRKVQEQRQRRSIAYMREQRRAKKNRAESIKNMIAGGAFGFVMVFGFFYAADHAVEKRNEAIGVHYEQYKQ